MKLSFVLFTVAGLACAANAQTRVWSNPAGGSWFTAANWTGGNVPDTAGESAQLPLLSGAYTVTLPSGTTIADLLVSSDTTLNLANNLTLTISASLIDNSGTIRVNSSGGVNSTDIILANNAVITGTGEIVLNATSNVVDRARIYPSGAGSSYTNGSDHTIHGSGNMYYHLINNGFISADQNGLILQFLQGSKTNNGVILATGGGILQVANDTIFQNPGALLLADGGTVNLINSATINGGDIRAISGGVIYVAGGGATLTGGATLSGPLQIENNNNLQLPTGLSHSGLLTINIQGGVNTTYLNPGTGSTLSGSGELILNASSNVYDRAQLYAPSGGSGFINAAGHTIRGSGNLYYQFTNNGLIRSGVAGQNLQLLNGTGTNNAAIEALNGDLLLTSETINQSASGHIDALGGGNVLLTSSTVAGGTMNSTSPSKLIASTGTSVLNAVTVHGQFDVNNNAALQLPAGISHTGTLTINAQGGVNVTPVTPGAGSTLSGSGEIVLNASSNSYDRAQLYAPPATAGFTNAAGHTIRGSGNIYYNLTNNGLIRSGTAGAQLQLREGTATNNATIQALNADVLLTSETVNQSASGHIDAIGAANVLLSSTTIRGGSTVASIGGRVIGASGTNVLDAVTVNGPFDVANNTVLALPTTLNNLGVITLNASGNVNVTSIQPATGAVISGSGEIVLNASSNSLDRAYIAAPSGGPGYTNQTGHTIRGSGNMYYNLTNNGTIRSGTAGAQIQLRDGTVSNNNTIQAVAGDVLLTSENVVQSPAGHIDASAGANVLMSASAIRGGTTNTSGASRIVASAGTNTLDAVTLNGAFDVANNAAVTIPTSITNNSVLTVNSSGGVNSTIVTLANGASVAGTGSINLNASSGVLDRAYIHIPAGSATNAHGHTIAGNGRIYGNILNHGILSPGLSVGRLEQAGGTYTQASDGSMDIELGGTGAGQSDLFAGNTPKVLSGAINISYASGFSMSPCQTITIITGSSITGQFTTVNAPAVAYGVIAVVYTPTSVTVSYIPGDFNGDGVPDFFDYDDFVQAFEAGEQRADFDHDGTIDFFDYDAFVQAFESPC